MNTVAGRSTVKRPSTGEVASRRLAQDLEQTWARGPLAEGRGELDPQGDPAADDTYVVRTAFEAFSRQRALGADLDPVAFAACFPRVEVRLRRALTLHDVLDDHSDWLDVDALWPQPGKPFLGFLLGEQLGMGAFSQVHLATEPALGDRPVAVKISRRGLAEAWTLGRLSHAHVVPVHSVHEDPDSDLSLVCMPYLGCATLADVIGQAFAAGRPTRARVLLEASRRPLPSGKQAPEIPTLAPPDAVLLRGSYLDGALHLAVQMAEALAFVHDQNVLHRDLKPSNVLMGPDGRPRLLDFNLSADAQAVYARLGGTLNYASPEQLRGLDPVAPSGSGLDARSDVFSLGVMLYELFSGRHPFGPAPQRLEREVLRRHLLERLRGEHEPLTRANPEVDPDLAAVVEKCLAHDPGGRHQTAAELAGGLRRCLARRQRARARRGWLAGVVLAAVLLPLAVAGLVWGEWLPPVHYWGLSPLARGERAATEKAYPEALKALSEAVKANPDRPEPWAARAAVYQQRGEAATDPKERVDHFTKAAADFDKAGQLSGDPKYLVRAGYCYSRCDRHAPAVTAYRQAVAADERLDTAEVNFDLALTLWRSGGPTALKEAKPALDRSIFLAPQLQRPHQLRAMIGLQDALNQPGPVPDRVTGDIEKALAVGEPTTDLYRDAAWVFAVAAARNPALTGKALAFVGLAVEAGQDPQWFRDDLAFETLRRQEGFEAAVTKARRREPSRLPQFLDPLPEPRG
jgi:eukaryotic-like serine/threonine-protein kinase